MRRQHTPLFRDRSDFCGRLNILIFFVVHCCVNFALGLKHQDDKTGDRDIINERYHERFDTNLGTMQIFFIPVFW